MSKSLDDLEKYINSQLTVQDNNNRNLTVAQKQFAESALISLVEVAIVWLEHKNKIDSSTAKIIRNSVSFIDNVGKLFRWW